MGIGIIVRRQVTIGWAYDPVWGHGVWQGIEEGVFKEAGNHTLGMYVDKRQAKFAEWVVLRLIIEICSRDTGYEVRGRRSEPWWRQTAARKHLIETLEDILEVARARCWESGRCGKGGGGREVAESDVGSDRSWYYGTEIGDNRVGV